MQPDVLSRFLADKQKLGAGAVGLLALVCMAYLALALYQDIAIARPLPAASYPLDQPSAAIHASTVSIEALTNAQFFGASLSSHSSQQAQQESVPETRMSLELHGVIGSTLVEQGRALIAQRGQGAKYYGINDTLPGGAAVYSIATSQVVLSRDGRLETLSFPKPQTHADATTFAASPREDPTEAAAPPDQFQSLQESQFAEQTADDPSISEQPSQASLSIKERLKQLRESRDL
jgi:type II secretory pathway component PulC